MPPEENIALIKEFLQSRLAGLERSFERELAQVRSAIEKLAENMITSFQFEQLQKDISSLRADADELEVRLDAHLERLNRLENTNRVLKWLAGIASAVIAALAIALATKVLGG